MSIKIKIISAVVMIIVCASFCQAMTNYYVVPANINATVPYTSWATAATNIQTVINIALGGDTIYITNGHYYLANQISVGKGVIIRSFHNGITDPTNTIIDGNNYTGKSVTNRCISITSTATVDGLMFTNGSTSFSDNSGGGCSMSAGLLTNCIITGNFATNYVYAVAGGIYALYPRSTIANCQIIGNTTMSWGGGIYIAFGAILKNSVIGWNYTPGVGSGLGLSDTSTVFNCDIVSNRGGSAVIQFVGSGTVVSNCTIRGNTNCTAFTYYQTYYTNNLITHCSIIDNYGGSGAGGTVADYTKVRNCLIARNKATGNGGGLYINNTTGYVESCTIVSNYAAGSGGGVYDNNSVGIFFNTIVCSNNSPGSYKDLYAPGSTINYFYNSCCQTVSLPPAQGNIQSDPLFVDAGSGNYRLSQNSPCINTGANQDWMTNSFDLDRRLRLDKFSGLVDMGCYEYIFLNGIVTSVE